MTTSWRSAASGHRRELRYALAISVTILIAELAVGVASNSLAVLADAGHVFADVAASGLVLVAVWFGARPASERRSFGFHRTEILAAVVNAVVLFGIAALILVEAARRFTSEPVIAPGPVIAVSLFALVANAASAWLLHGGEGHSLAVRSAYLEVLNDAFGAAAVLVSGIVIALTGFTRADAIASALIGLLILPRTWGLLREALDVLLEATPRRVDMAEVRRHILEAQGVAQVHDLHAWTITSGLNVLSAHVVIADGADSHDVLDALSQCLADDFDIEHSTFQLEPAAHRGCETLSHA